MIDPRAELRQQIAAKIDEKMHSERMEDHFDGWDYADAVMELFRDWTVDVEYQFGTEQRTVWVGPWEPVETDDIEPLPVPSPVPRTAPTDPDKID